MATKSGTRGQGPEGRRPTKAERREQARLEREAIRRRMDRRRRTRNAGLALVVVAVVVAVAAVVVLQPDEAPGSTDDPQALLQEATAAVAAASCDDVQTIDPYGGVSDPNAPGYIDQVHVGSGDFLTAPKLSTYPSVPPTSGPHAPIPPGPIGAGVYDAPPDINRALHALEHGAAIVWYRPGTSGPAFDRLTAFYSSDQDAGQDRVIVAPYDYPDQGKAGQLPDGVNMALVSWHKLETCGSVSLPVAFDFTSQYSGPPWADRAYRGEAPEAGASL